MIQDTLTRILADAAAAAAPELGLDPADLPSPELERPRQREHGDFSTNLALILAPRARRGPREVAARIAERVPTGGQGQGHVERVEVAGPGFVNLFLGPGWLHDVLAEIAASGERYGQAESPTGQRAQVEFVSANPTGPLHVGTARNAAIGDSLANVLAAAGVEVEREYYFNDTGRQIDLFGESVAAWYLRRFGVEAEMPEDGYQGEYVKDLAEAIAAEHGDALVHADPEERRKRILEETVARTMDGIRATLERFRVRFDSFRLQRELEESGGVLRAIGMLRERGLVYDAEGAVFFRATELGDEKDRVLIRSNGAPTYFAADCAYMLDKAARGFDRFVYVWGADHHGDLARMRGAADALGVGRDRLEFVLYQLVTLYRAGQPVRMSRRAGEFVTLDELLDEVGPDAARYTLLTRSHDSPLDFDIEAVTRQSMENPVYYVQYAHARIASLLGVAAGQGVDPGPWEAVDASLLRHPSELELLRRLSELPEVIERAAGGLAPHRLTTYAEAVAAAFHRFYTDCRVITDDEATTRARLWLSAGTKQVVAIVLGLIGVSAPESMQRMPDDGG
jgi:arginyl-tRNA synthetase